MLEDAVIIIAGVGLIALLVGLVALAWRNGTTRDPCTCGSTDGLHDPDCALIVGDD